MRKSLLLLNTYISMIFVARQIQVTDKKEVSKNPQTSLYQRTDSRHLSKIGKSEYKASQIEFRGNDFGDVTELSYIEK